MAEIRVERKRGGGNWLWLVLLLLVVAAVVAYLWYNGTISFGALPAQEQLAVWEEAWHATIHV
jgi:hypothetical protein